MSRLIPLMSLCIIILMVKSTLTLETLEQLLGGIDNQELRYKIPDPFHIEENKFKKRINGDEYYYIMSVQKSGSPRTTLVLEDYFSLDSGISYSFHSKVDQEGQPKQSWALIGDGSRGKSYIVRYIDNSNELIDCELDHAHTGRQSFPWQFAYDEELANMNRKSLVDVHSSGNTRPKKSASSRHKKNQEDRRRIWIYGVGAIWLNAITADARSNQVGQESLYDSKNVWVLYRDNLEIELIFLMNESDSQSVSDHDKLKEIHIKRESPMIHGGPDHTKANENLQDAARVHQRDYDFISVELMRSGLTEAKDIRIQEFISQLSFCRRETKGHRIFPSLLRAISVSPNNAFILEYIARFRPPFNKNSEAVSDLRWNDHFPTVEYRKEALSLELAAQRTMYQALPFGNDAESWHSLIHIYLKLFTARTHSDPEQSLCHSTAHYHLIGSSKTQEIISCQVGGTEPRPSEAIYERVLHFHKGWMKEEYRGRLSGLSALLMNAAYSNYKEFSLFSKNITLRSDPFNLDNTRKVTVDEWQLIDQAKHRSVHFYFERVALESSRESEARGWKWWQASDLHQHSMLELSQRLVRIEVRDSEGQSGVTSSETEKENKDENYDLLAQFDIVEFKFELEEEELSLFSPPEVCYGTDQDSDDEDAATNQESHSDEEYYSSVSHEDSDLDEDPQYDEDGLDDDFEFRPSHLVEEYQFPEFLEFVHEQSAYKIVSQITVHAYEHESTIQNDARVVRHIFLSETVDLKNEITELKLYFSRDRLDEDRPDELYFINYASELIFEVKNDRCLLLDDLDSSWLTLFSAPMSYYTLPERLQQKGSKTASSADSLDILKEEAVLESNKLRSLGIGALWRRAVDSNQVEFLGRLKKVITKPDTSDQFTHLVWSLNENNMQVRFYFLLKLSRAQHEAKSTRKYYMALDPTVLVLDSIHVSGQIDDDSSSFPYVRIQILSFEGKANGGMHVPARCLDQLREAKRLLGRSDIDLHPPTLAQLLGENAGSSSSYHLEYSVSHSIFEPNQLRKASNSPLVLISEIFDSKANRARLFMHNEVAYSNLEIYIEGQKKKIYAYSFDHCSQIQPNSLRDLVGVHDLSNKNFEASRFYGLGALWTELAKQKGKLHIYSRFDKSGRRTEVYNYRILLVDPETKLEQKVRMVFVKQRSAPWLFYETSTMVRNKEPLELEEIVISNQYVTGLRNAGTSNPVVEFLSSQTDLSKPGKDSYLKTRIKVVEPLTEISPDLKWELPDACEKMKLESEEQGLNYQDIKSVTPSAKPEFPSLSFLLANSYELHTRSEVSIKNKQGKYALHLLDEWIHDGKLRMKASRIGDMSGKRSLDFILYTKTSELFDISQKFQCGNKPPTSILLVDERKDTDCQVAESNLIEFFSSLGANNEHQKIVPINHLGNLHFGPLALWRLGQSDSVETKLVQRYNFTLPNLTEEQQVEQLNNVSTRVKGIEIWHVNSKPGSEYSWSYEMRFLIIESRNERDGLLVSNYDLDSILIHNYGSKADAGSVEAKVSIDLLNYRIKTPKDVTDEQFVLPQGYGCTRSLDAFDIDEELFDDIFISQDIENLRLSYEASIELYESWDSKAKNKSKHSKFNQQQIPSLTGAYARMKNLGQLSPGDISVHLKRRLKPDQSEARKTITDSSNGFLYMINELTGVCHIVRLFDDDQSESSRDRMLPMFSLDFSSFEPNYIHQEIVIDEDLFKKLFIDTFGQGYSKLNSYENRGNSDLGFITYERHFDSLKLSDKLNGPATVTRSFEHGDYYPMGMMSHPKNSKLNINLHDTMSVRIISFKEANKDAIQQVRLPKAVIDIRLNTAQPSQLHEFLEDVEITECFNDEEASWQRRMARYTIEYPISNHSARLLAYMGDSFYIESLYNILISKMNLQPLQLDGKARLDYDLHDNIMKIHFNVLDAQPSHLCFGKKLGAILNDNLTRKAEFKLATSYIDCSNWCDHLGPHCMAMSYCEDHRCWVLSVSTPLRYTNFDLESPLQKSVMENKQTSSFIEVLASSYQADPICSYYYRDKLQAAMTLRHFSQQMNRMINLQRDEKELKQVSLKLLRNLENQLIVPIKFYENQHTIKLSDAEQEEYNDQDETEPDSRVMAQLHDDNEWQRAFILWARGLDIDFSKFRETIPKDKADNLSLINVILQTKTQSECMKNCALDPKCLIYSYCKSDQRCKIVAPIAKRNSQGISITDFEVNSIFLEWLKENASDKAQPMTAPICDVYMRDYLAQFNKFDNTLVPQNQEQRYDSIKPTECALLCQSANSSRCLSFDVCHYVRGKSSLSLFDFNVQLDDHNQKSTCFLQNTHNTLDSFERDIFLPSFEVPNGSRSTIDDKDVVCNHYSKSVADSDFKRIANSKLSSKAGVTIRGVSLDRCAINCHLDDQCEAFEFCLNERQIPARSCRLIKTENITELATLYQESNDLKIDAKFFAMLFKDSETCSIYVQRRRAFGEKLDSIITSSIPITYFSSSIDSASGKVNGLKRKHPTGWDQYGILILMGYMTLAVIIGIVIQLAYIRVIKMKQT